MYNRCTGWKCAAQICCMPVSCSQHGVTVTFADICDDGSSTSWGLKAKANGQVTFALSGARTKRVLRRSSPVATYMGTFQGVVSAEVTISGWGSVTVPWKVTFHANKWNGGGHKGVTVGRPQGNWGGAITFKLSACVLWSGVATGCFDIVRYYTRYGWWNQRCYSRIGVSGSAAVSLPSPACQPTFAFPAPISRPALSRWYGC